MGCVEEGKPTDNASSDAFETESKKEDSTLAEQRYYVEFAIQNGDVVDVHGQHYNEEKLEQFMVNVKKRRNDKVRITRYTIEGDALIIDLEFDGEKIYYTYDTTRDAYGEHGVFKKEFPADSIYKTGSEYYLKDSSDEVWLY